MIKVAVFGIVASLIAMKIKTIRPEIAILIAVISSIPGNVWIKTNGRDFSSF